MDNETDERLTFDDWTEDDGDKIALRMNGDAMIGEGILDGDFVVIRKADRIEKDGDIIAFRDYDGDVTLRRLYVGGNHVTFMAANPDIKPQRRDKVAILGVLVGVVRKY